MFHFICKSNVKKGWESSRTRRKGKKRSYFVISIIGRTIIINTTVINDQNQWIAVDSIVADSFVHLSGNDCRRSMNDMILPDNDYHYPMSDMAFLSISSYHNKLGMLVRYKSQKLRIPSPRSMIPPKLCYHYITVIIRLIVATTI